MGRTRFFDNDGRRSGADRRVFSYAVYIPERRSGHSRRNGLDRRGNHEVKHKLSKSVIAPVSYSGRGFLLPRKSSYNSI